MNMKVILSKIKRRLQSRTKLREVLREVEWLAFENKTILSFLSKYNIIKVKQEARKLKIPIIQEDVYVKNVPTMTITILES